MSPDPDRTFSGQSGRRESGGAIINTTSKEHSMGDITNTTKIDPVVPMVAALGDGSLTPFIEGQEAQGQREVVNSTKVPTDLNGGDQADYEALGFVFGDPDPADPMFRAVTLPGGWTREGSGHAMWSYILDADGCRRVAIFYKAAFYDRRAHMNIVRVPQTAAQADAWQEVADSIGYGGQPDYDEPFWQHGEERRDGPNYVYAYRGCKGTEQAERDGDRYGHGGVNRYADDGRRIEIHVAPGGTIVDRREFSVDPTESGG